MPVGPQLPPSVLDKRKRDDAEESNSSESDSDTGPAPPPPPSSEIVAKKPRVIGPTLPPAPLDQRPSEPASTSPHHKDHNESEDSSGDDDDFGPSLPTSNPTYNSSIPSRHTASIPSTTASTAPSAPKRDDWMTLAPSSSDWSSRVDPTKLKNRKFNTGKGAKGPSSTEGDASSAWYETPTEKQARLQREVMGIKEDTNGGRPTPRSEAAGTSEADRETARRMAEYNKSRGPSLYQSHHVPSTSTSTSTSTATSKSQDRDKSKEDDDPSARAFDREKDIGGGLQINATQRREMVKKASNFRSRFASARYL